jgi:outer membrane protein assembly factor BamB
MNNLFVFLTTLFIVSCNGHSSSTAGIFHADQSHTGVYPAQDFKNFGLVKWKYKTNGKIFSSPVIAEGLAFVGSEDSCLYALDATSGALRWKLPTGGAVSSSPAVFGNAVYFASYDGFCYAADTRTGVVIWKFKTGGEKKIGAIGLWTMKPSDMYMEDLWDFFLSSPVVDDNQNPAVYFGSSDGNLYALDAQTGKEKWRFQTGGIIHSSPAFNNGTVYFGSWDTYFYAVNAETGKEKWKFKTKDQPVYHVLEGIQASPTIGDSTVYFGARDGFFYALNANTGSMRWNYSADNSWVLTTAALKDSTLYFGTSDTYLMIALDAKSGEKKWTMKASGYLYSSPAIAGHTAFYGDFTGNMYALDLGSEGKSFKTFSTQNRNANALRILNPKGDLDFAFTAGTQDLAYYESNADVMHEFYTLGSIVSSPVISNHMLYFGSADGNLYALELNN